MRGYSAQPVGAPQLSRRLRIPGRLQSVVAVLAVLVLLELATVGGILPERDFPRVSDDLRTLVTQLGAVEFWTSVGQTLLTWAVGFVIAAVIGVVAGILIGANEMLYRTTHVVIEFMRPIPSVALIPLAVLVYGTGAESAIFLAAFASIWPVLVQAIYGMRDVDPVALDTVRAFGISRLQRVRSVLLPSAFAYVATGLRIASATALILVVSAELVIGAPGLGAAINLAQSGNDVRLMYALIIATGLLGWLLNGIFTWLERRLLHWHPARRGVETAK